MRTVNIVLGVALCIALTGAGYAACGTCPKAEVEQGCTDCKAGQCDKAKCIKTTTTAAATTVVEKTATISTEALTVLVKTGSVPVILDARSGKYDDGRRIPGAKSLTDQATAAEAAALIPTKAALVVTYCASLKCPASAGLAAHLRELGYTNIIEYPAGIAGWTEAGNTVEQPAK